MDQDPEMERATAGISWKAMLFILLAVLIAASAIAYWLIFPFFHQHA